jgi:hypothetical protein
MGDGLRVAEEVLEAHRLSVEQMGSSVEEDKFTNRVPSSCKMAAMNPDRQRG